VCTRDIISGVVSDTREFFLAPVEFVDYVVLYRVDTALLLTEYRPYDVTW